MLINILLIENDEAMVEMLRRLFEEISEHFDTTPDLIEGVKLANEQAYHLILLDLRLDATGKQDALNVIRTLKSHGSAPTLSGRRACRRGRCPWRHRDRHGP